MVVPLLCQFYLPRDVVSEVICRVTGRNGTERFSINFDSAIKIHDVSTVRGQGS